MLSYFYLSVVLIFWNNMYNETSGQTLNSLSWFQNYRLQLGFCLNCLPLLIKMVPCCVGVQSQTDTKYASLKELKVVMLQKQEKDNPNRKRMYIILLIKTEIFQNSNFFLEWLNLKYWYRAYAAFLPGEVTSNSNINCITAKHVFLNLHASYIAFFLWSSNCLPYLAKVSSHLNYYWKSWWSDDNAF